MKTVADQVAETLAAAGVKRIYGIVGDSLNDLTDAIPRQTKIEWMHVPHEEVADLAAGAEAHLTGEFAVCAGSCRPDNLYFVEFEQKSTGLLGFGTELNNPNFAAMAQESGMRGFRLTHPAAVEQGFADALAHDDFVLIDAVVAERHSLCRLQSGSEMAKPSTLISCSQSFQSRRRDRQGRED